MRTPGVCKRRLWPTPRERDTSSATAGPPSITFGIHIALHAGIKPPLTIA